MNSQSNDKVFSSHSNRRWKEGPKPSARDDLDLMLQHENFPTLLELTIQIHKGYQTIQDQTGRSYTTQQNLPNSSLTPEETMRATFCLQQKLLSDPDSPRTVIRRGQYPITDAIMDDSLRMLKQELKDVQEYVRNSFHKQVQSIDTSPVATKKGTKKEAIAIKYSKWQTDILMQWMVDHKDEPFPDQTALSQLMAQTGLSQSQVVNWTTNVRKRNKKATCQGGKKPHHFIDFLFLVQDREKQDRTHSKKPAPTVHRSVMVSPPRSCAPVFHNIEEDPFSIDEVTDDDLLEEFANCWLRNQHETVESLGDALDDFIAEHQSQLTLMPSVTDDSTEDEAPNRKRSRSFDLESELDDWVKEFDQKLSEFDVEVDM